MHCHFLCDQLAFCCIESDAGRRYNAEIMQMAVELMLRSRNCYKALRDILALPSIKTVKSYFGKLRSPDSLRECSEVISNVFSKLNGFEKYCFITADEIHVKPSLQFQKDKIIGFAADVDEPCVAKTVLAVMINPSMGAPAFVARLLPVFSLKYEFLMNQVNIVMKIIHDACGFVFLLMTDNLSVNQIMFKVYHQENHITAIYSFNHPINNPVFDTLFSFYDMPHCFKNIRSNWVTQPSRILEFIEPESQNVYQGKWNDLVKVYADESNSTIKQTKLSYAALYPTRQSSKQSSHMQLYIQRDNQANKALICSFISNSTIKQTKLSYAALYPTRQSSKQSSHMQLYIQQDNQANKALICSFISNSTIKQTKLSHAALYPTNFEKQKLQLVCDVFNEKSVVALEQRNLVGTAIFVKMVTKMWNIININHLMLVLEQMILIDIHFDINLVIVYSTSLRQRLHLKEWITRLKVEDCIASLQTRAMHCIKRYWV